MTILPDNVVTNDKEKGEIGEWDSIVISDFPGTYTCKITANAAYECIMIGNKRPLLSSHFPGFAFSDVDPATMKAYNEDGQRASRGGYFILANNGAIYHPTERSGNGQKYGRPFHKGDLVTSILTNESDDEISISFSINGECSGVAWRLPATTSLLPAVKMRDRDSSVQYVDI